MSKADLPDQVLSGEPLQSLQEQWRHCQAFEVGEGFESRLSGTGLQKENVETDFELL